MAEHAPGALRSHRRRRTVEEWALVLASQGLAPRVERAGGGFELHVPEGERERAAAVLRTWERENPPGPAAEAAPDFHWPTGLAIFTALLAFFAVTGPRDPAVTWFAAGSADAARIMGGEWWRATTALTLHADLGHVLGNTLAGVLFTSAVCGAVGPGTGAALVLAAGVLGNGANALFSAPHSSSVGASTAVFGAVGLLAALAVGRHRRRGQRGRRVAAPLAAGLALLAMLGTGERADLSGHLFGLAAGAVLGAAWSGAPRPRPGPLAQWAWAGGGAVWVGVCWTRALAS